MVIQPPIFSKELSTTTSELQHLFQQVRSYSLKPGENPTPFPPLTLWYFTGRDVQMPQERELYLYLILDGTLHLHTPSGMLDYIAGQYSISKIDTPTSGRALLPSLSGDFLALSLDPTGNDVISVVLELEKELIDAISRSSLPTPVKETADRSVLPALSRLLQSLDSPVQLSFLGRSICREVIFQMLCGSCGQQFLQSVTGVQQAGDIYRINSWIKENFRESFTVEDLAGQQNMSVSLFYQRFKSAVGMGPLQCQKRLRLTEARRLMLDEGKNVTQAAMDVGYESISQFNREYRRMYDLPPKEDILSLCRRLEH